MARTVLGIIGGSGFYQMSALDQVEEIALEAGKTRLLVNQLKDWELENVLILVEAVDEKLFLAARNLYKVEVLEVGKLNPVALVSHDNVLMTVAAVKLLEERLQ